MRVIVQCSSCLWFLDYLRFKLPNWGKPIGKYSIKSNSAGKSLAFNSRDFEESNLDCFAFQEVDKALVSA